MRQAVMTRPGEIAFRDVPVEATGKGRLRLRMRRIGVCGSDIHVWHGKHPYTSYPVVQGHEVAARVDEVGEGVQGFRVGDLVTVQPQVVCGRCHPCTHGLYNDCNELKVMGFQTTGMASDFFVVDAEKCIVLPEGMSEEHGAMVEPLAVACHAVSRYGDVRGKTAVVVGGGPIGNLVAQTLQARGAAKVLLTEVSAYRLDVARRCGIAAVDPRGTSLREVIAAHLGPDGADAIFECIGSPATLKEEIDVARKGSTVVVVGVVPDLCSVDMGFVQDHELTIVGSAMYRVEDYRAAIALLAEGRIALDALVTHHVPFTRYADAYRLIEEQKDRAMKVMIDMER